MNNGSGLSRLAVGEARMIRPDSVARTARKAAILVCDTCTLRNGGGLKARLHRFEAVRDCGAGREAVYRCDDCGALRRWGLE